MSRSSLRKLAAAGLGAALIGSGLTVGLGAGVASADADCNASEIINGEKGVTVTQTASPATIYAGGTVTVTTKVKRTADAWNLSEVGVFQPAGFVIDAKKSTVDAFHASGQKVKSVTMQSDPGKGLYWTKSGTLTGWDMTSGHVILSNTFTVPSDAKLDSTHQFGSQAKPINWNSQEWPNRGACVTVRAKNPIESATGSLDDIGLGSVNTGSSNIFGSATDPAGSVGNIVDGINIGKIFGDLLKSGS